MAGRSEAARFRADAQVSKGGGAIRWSEEQLAEHQKRLASGPVLPDRPLVAPPRRDPAPAQPQPTGKQKLQALGRLRDGQMNKSEAAFADYLDALKHDGKVLWWKFEGIKLKLADNTHLTVDFAVLRADGQLEMVDVKGARAIVQDDAKAKIKVAAAMFPFAFFLAYPRKAKDGGGWDIEAV